MQSTSVSTAVWRAHYPFDSRYLSVDGCRCHYLDEFTGQSPRGTLLFVHGNPSWSFHWRELIKSLRRDYRCVAIDHLGCGLSERTSSTLSLQQRIDHLAQFVDDLGLSETTLVAQDWGGAIGLGTVLAQRERFNRVVLFNTGAFTPTHFPWRIRVCRTPMLGRLAVQGANLFTRAALSMTLIRKKRLPPDIAAGYLAGYDNWRNRQAVYDFVADIPASPRHPTWQTLLEIEKRLPELADLPIMLIWGMQDWCFRPDCLDRFQQAWPNADVHKLHDVGHWVVEDAPAESLELITVFLNRL